MRQITKNKIVPKKPQKNSHPSSKDPRLPKMAKPMKGKRKHPDFGTSQLEQDFARDFLDKLGIEYVWQFEAKEIGRFYDYFLPKSKILLEIDGDYYHGYGLVREEMNPMQKRSFRVDRDKDAWAALHGIPLIRIWEHDIHENPSGIMKMLKERLYIQYEKLNKEREKNKRHVNKLNKDGKDK